MLSFSQVKSAGSAGNYYTEKDNYYVIGSMEERWQGKGAELLGLEGKVDKQVFTELLQGKLPDGSDLTRIQDGVNKHRPGYDLTFSAPKSVSMLAMLGGDKRLIDAHNRAVTVALNQVESLASTRVKKDGVSETVLTGNLIIARFNHDTSRAQDPQIHTHSVVINATQNGDKWQTLASDTVGKTGFSETILANRIAFGKIYQNSLRADVESMGYKTAMRVGMACGRWRACRLSRFPRAVRNSGGCRTRCLPEVTGCGRARYPQVERSHRSGREDGGVDEHAEGDRV
ncbi:MobF family relaxase [Klebsiella quasipneumoniae]|uniref:MobF family relaxase n=1 Tax=Klebsiella quasipneumoniae TaxID=1463165 RepID=UPI003890F696